MSLKNAKNSLTKRNHLVDILVILFGISSWIGTNSVFVQLPLLVLEAPEGWNIASYVVIIIQLANLGPIFYGFIQKSRLIKDSHIIYGLLCINVAAAFIMAMMHDYTAHIFGARRSVALLAMVFCLSLVGCTSSVLFMPQMAKYRKIYLITYLTGEGLSGFLPSCLALVQGVGGNTICVPKNSTVGNQTELILEPYTPSPRFGTQSFFFVVSAILIGSLLSFIFLENSKTCRKKLLAPVEIGNYSYDCSEKEISTPLAEFEQKIVEENIRARPKQLSERQYQIFLVLLGFICMCNIGLLPAITIFSALPYGNITYHFVVTLNSIANPIACFMAVFLPHTSIKNIVVMTLLAGPLVGYALITSIMSPNPPLMGTFVGSAIVIITWTLISGLFSYVRLCITAIFRERGGKALVWIGAWTQIGSFTGAIISFSLVNFTNLFQPYKHCS